jgi:hypothetical protein
MSTDHKVDSSPLADHDQYLHADGKLSESLEHHSTESAQVDHRAQRVEVVNLRGAEPLPTLDLAASKKTTSSQEMEFDEPILLLACDCDKLLGEGALKVRDMNPTARASLDEYRRRFQAWSKYCGVFADKTINLDHRVRKKPQIQDIIVR